MFQAFTDCPHLGTEKDAELRMLMENTVSDRKTSPSLFFVLCRDFLYSCLYVIVFLNTRQIQHGWPPQVLPDSNWWLRVVSRTASTPAGHWHNHNISR